jgi:hypothetical protein
MKPFTDETVVAKRVGTGYYHKGCAPENAIDVKASDEQELFDPILDHTACLECGRWILTPARRIAYGEYCEVKRNQ